MFMFLEAYAQVWHVSRGFRLTHKLARTRLPALPTGAMPITCRICGATNNHWTVHCPDRPDRDSSEAKQQQKAPSKASGNNGKNGRSSGYGTGVGQKVGDRCQQLAQQAADQDSKPWIRHKCAGNEAATRRFMRIRPSAVNFSQFGHLYTFREKKEKSCKENVKGLQAEWTQMAARRDLSIADLEDGLKQLSARHGVQVGKWLFFLPREDMDRVWPELVWALSMEALGEAFAMKVGCTDTGCEDTQDTHLCCVYMENCFDPGEQESVRSSLQALLSGLVTKVVDLYLKPDSYSYCQIYRGNRWKLSPTLATCKVHRFKGTTLQALTLQDPFQHDLRRLAPLLEQNVEAALLILDNADSQGAMLESLHAVALHPHASELPIIKMCATLKETRHIKGILARVGRMMRGLVDQDAAFILGFGSRVFAHSEFMRMHLANVRLLGDLFMHEIIPEKDVRYLVLQLEAERLTLPSPSTWAFVLQNLRSMAQGLTEAKPRLSRWLGSIVRGYKVSSQERLRILTLNVWFDEEQRELRTAILLSALQQLGPAIFCFQEVTEKVAVDIQRAFPTWSSSDPGDGSSVGHYGVMILSCKAVSGDRCIFDVQTQYIIHGFGNTSGDF